MKNICTKGLPQAVKSYHLNIAMCDPEIIIGDIITNIHEFSYTNMGGELTKGNFM